MYNYFMNLSFGSLLVALLTIVIPPWGHVALAEYTLVLKNGRRITVQAYREEGGMIKFHGLGGEIGIGKDQVQTILKAGEREGRGFGVSRAQSVEAEPMERTPEQIQPTPATTGREPTVAEKAGAPPTAEPRTEADLLAEERAKEEKEYQRRVKEITEQIKANMERYSVAGKGGSTMAEALLGKEEAIRARADDLNARLRDQQHNPGAPADAGSVGVATPSPFTGQPPVIIDLRPGEASGSMYNATPSNQPTVNPPPLPYSDRERGFSELRNRTNELINEREKLIQEMKQKNFETGDLFLQ